MFCVAGGLITVDNFCIDNWSSAGPALPQQDESGPPLADTESTPATLPEQHEAVAGHESADQTCKSSDGNPHESQTGVGLGSSEILPDIEDSQPYPGPTQERCQWYSQKLNPLRWYHALSFLDLSQH